ncbi:DUF2652 domain-containing protein [uncultured Roseivirga sp.]|uniref:DUF2652 domain-containing protein n=1 Tax=uncultured Roseivirga sp. TaxID=543088 RepID=UPI0030D895E8|tara:strand:+ start:17163 stop:18257 length:1095 start_codon:yes stop_codon:yes gene_type:complete
MLNSTKGLIFIPDISGFTSFVKKVEIEHSRLIVEELLEVLIDTNEMELIVSEIEGDAILFYKFGEKPNLKVVHQQVKKMFTAFHKSLMAYVSRKYCQCEACLSASDLTLKVITHYGEFTEYNVKNFSKLIGKDVIVAHELLKNDIDHHEYWLVSEGLFKKSEMQSETVGSIIWTGGQKTTKDENIPFHYSSLGYLKSKISVETPKKPNLQTKRKVISISKTYNTDLITLLHATADFTYRNQWVNEVNSVEVQNHFLPRIGMRCVMNLPRKKVTIIANHYIFGEHKIEFSETEESTGWLSYYTLEKLEDFRTLLTFNYYINDQLFSGFLFKLLKQARLKKITEKSLTNLEGLVEKLGDSIRIKAQ